MQIRPGVNVRSSIRLTGVTSALQIAFDSTLLALFLSAALMLVQTLVYRRSEDLLARIDRAKPAGDSLPTKGKGIVPAAHAETSAHGSAH